MTASLRATSSREATNLYDRDIVAWAEEQARLLRAGRLTELDIEHIAEEIEDVGKSEQRELASRLSLLLAHLIKWRFQPERRGNSWLRTMRAQRHSLAIRLRRTPSLRVMLRDPDWIEAIWQDAVGIAAAETWRADLPESCPWTLSQVLDQDWMPEP
jgi:hypothetical protein